MAKILLIDEGKAKPLNKVKFTQEVKLQNYLEKYPYLIPIGEAIDGASELICIGKEVSVPSGAVDLLYIDKDGFLTIVETKLIKNPEIRRAVIGQLIEYASYVSQWNADDVDRVVEKYCNKELEEVVAQDGQELVIEDFRLNIERHLKEGRVRLVIAVDELNEVLRSTITFLNSHSTFDILVLQVSSFEETESRKVLVSSIFGYARKETGSRPSKPKIGEEVFLARCRESKHGKAAELYLKARSLKENRSSSGDFINWGVSGYSYRMPWEGHPSGEILFTAYSDGKLMIWPDLLVRTGEIGQKYFEKLRSMPILTNAFSRYKYPTISTDKMKTSDIDTFIAAIKELGLSLDEISKEQT